MRKYILLLLYFGLSISGTVSDPRIAHAQKATVHLCKGTQASKYTIEVGPRTIRSPVQLLLQVGVKPKQFNRTDMMLLAKQLNNDFCHEQGLYVAIYDSPRSVKEWHWSLDYARTGGESKTGPLRGFYYLNRATDEERITFSTERNNPLDEVVIILGESKQN